MNKSRTSNRNAQAQVEGKISLRRRFMHRDALMRTLNEILNFGERPTTSWVASAGATSRTLLHSTHPEIAEQVRTLVSLHARQVRNAGKSEAARI